MLTREPGGLFERPVQRDVRVQVDDFGGSLLQEVTQQRRLDGGRQLRDVVDSRQAADLDGIQADVPQAARR